jgi:hypothetical protein
MTSELLRLFCGGVKMKTKQFKTKNWNKKLAGIKVPTDPTEDQGQLTAHNGIRSKTSLEEAIPTSENLTRRSKRLIRRRKSRDQLGIW